MARTKINSEEQWLELRHGYVTASEVAALFYSHPWTSYYELWATKKDKKRLIDHFSDRGNIGHYMEPAIARWFQDEIGVKLVKSHCFYYNQEYRLGATPDFQFRKGGVLVEIKNVDYLMYQERWCEWDAENNQLIERPPIYYQLQLQTQLFCTGLKHGFIVACIGGNELKYWEYDYHEAAVDRVKEAANDFWHAVDNNIEPTITGHDYKAVMTYYVDSDDRIPPSDLSGNRELDIKCRRLVETTAEKKSITLKEQELKAQIIATVGDARKAFTEGYKISAPTVANKNGKHRRLTVKEKSNVSSSGN